MEYYLLLIETSGNQSYLFDTNRLKENVGASQLTYLAGTRFVLEAIADSQVVQEAITPKLWSEDPKALRKNILNHSTQVDLPIQVIVATSGKAILLVPSRQVGKNIIAYVTEKSLQEAPGLDICGVVSEQTVDLESDDIHQSIKNIHQQILSVRATYPGSITRFPVSPITALCASSSLPAWGLEKNKQRQTKIQGALISRACQAKQDHYRSWLMRLNKILQSYPAAMDYSTLYHEGNIDKFFEKDEQSGWRAVVHADGNGLGQIFLRFDQYIGTPPQGESKNIYYINMLRRFSIELEEVTEKSFCDALCVLEPKAKRGQHKSMLPIIPLVLGGDDLTVICDGSYALEFTRVFLQQFEYYSRISETISQLTNQSGLAACAGVAISKAHFPFSNAYTLAEQLLKSAKQVKQKVIRKSQENVNNKGTEPLPCSALDFHVLYDTSFTNLEDIRKRLEYEDRVLTTKPYVVTTWTELELADVEDPAWVRQHDVRKLIARIMDLDERHNGRRLLSSTQMHQIREALFISREEANARFSFLQPPLQLDSLTTQRFNGLKDSLAEQDNDLFRENGKQKGETAFLDALEAIEFWAINTYSRADTKDEAI